MEAARKIPSMASYVYGSACRSTELLSLADVPSSRTSARPREVTGADLAGICSHSSGEGAIPTSPLLLHFDGELADVGVSISSGRLLGSPWSQVHQKYNHLASEEATQLGKATSRNAPPSRAYLN